MMQIGTVPTVVYLIRLKGMTTAELLDCTGPGRATPASKQNATGCPKNHLR